MNIWFTSDHHFSDENALKYRYRPFKDTDEMDEAMIRIWNQFVGPKDIVYYLGDFATEDDNVNRFLSQLNYGKIILMVGNHDYKRSDIALGYFDEVHYDPIELEIDKDLDVHGEGDRLWLCHYPLQRHPDLYTVTGHIHNLFQIAQNMVNIGVDAWHFRPVSLQTILECRHAEKEGHWDANVYPDASLEWQWEVSTKRKRNSFEPTLPILIDNIKKAGLENIMEN